MQDQTLKPAADLAAGAGKPYPNDSAEYRAARTALLAEEIDLRRRIERVAAQRRALPPGGKVPQDYGFTAESGGRVLLSEMFGGSDTLVTYFWMYGPERERPCPMCTSFVGSLDLPARDIMQRVPIAIIGRSPIARQLAFKRERGLAQPEILCDGERRFRPRLSRFGGRRQRMAGVGGVYEAGQRGQAVLERRTRRGNR